jgi:hypothetical protein
MNIPIRDVALNDSIHWNLVQVSAQARVQPEASSIQTCDGLDLELVLLESS